MNPREWMTLALRILGVWFAVLTFAAILSLLAAFLSVFFSLIRLGGSDFAATVGRLGGSLLAVFQHGVPAALLLLFATQVTERIFLLDRHQRVSAGRDKPPQAE